NQVANPAQLFVTERVRGLVFKHHFAALKHRSFRNNHCGIATGVLPAVCAQQFRQLLDIKFMFWNHATIGGSRHRWQHGGESGGSPETSHNHEPPESATQSATI